MFQPAIQVDQVVTEAAQRVLAKAAKQKRRNQHGGAPAFGRFVGFHCHRDAVDNLKASTKNRIFKGVSFLDCFLCDSHQRTSVRTCPSRKLSILQSSPKQERAEARIKGSLASLMVHKKPLTSIFL